jgi:hypothetical protein
VVTTPEVILIDPAFDKSGIPDNRTSAKSADKRRTYALEMRIERTFIGKVIKKEYKIFIWGDFRIFTLYIGPVGY